MKSSAEIETEMYFDSLTTLDTGYPSWALIYCMSAIRRCKSYSMILKYHLKKISINQLTVGVCCEKKANMDEHRGLINYVLNLSSICPNFHPCHALSEGDKETLVWN